MRSRVLAKYDISVRNLVLVSNLLAIVVSVDSRMVLAFCWTNHLTNLSLLGCSWGDGLTDLASVTWCYEIDIAIIERGCDGHRRHIYFWIFSELHVCWTSVNNALWRYSKLLHRRLLSFFLFVWHSMLLWNLSHLSRLTLMHLLLVVYVANHTRIHCGSINRFVDRAQLLDCAVVRALACIFTR